MSKHSGNSQYSTKEEEEMCLRRDSDMSGEETSDEDSEISFDSEEEEMLLEGKDTRLDKPSSDLDSEPGTLFPVAVEESTSEGLASTTQRGRGCGRRVRSSSNQAESSTGRTEERWNDIDVPDVTPPQPTFRPAHSPGPQLIHKAPYTFLQLFQLFFTTSTLQNIIRNTNEFGSTHHATPSDPWIDVTLEDMFSFMSLVVYMGVVKCCAFTDYWRGGKLYAMPFPQKVMTGQKFLRISRSLHFSSLVTDAANEQKRGTANFDRLCKIKPLYEEIREACRRNYHPSQEIAVDERILSSKACIAIKKKCFVLVDSSNGYTWDFFIYGGKFQGKSGKGLSYDLVMELIDTRLLGTGYKLYVDTCYTSPTLFNNLLQKQIWACGTICSNMIGFPKTHVNRLGSKSARGSIRWIRKDSLLFVQWRDARDVFMCSTLHTAHGEDTIRKKVKGADGHRELKDIPVPPAVKEYNRCTGGVDLTGPLMGHYEVLHKTMKWYQTLFYHFMDIAILNAFLLHKELAKGHGEIQTTQKAFRETLSEQLAEVGCASTAEPEADHKPVYIGGDGPLSRLKCRQCNQKTPLKCSSCNVPLCLIRSRDCYNEWHTVIDLFV